VRWEIGDGDTLMKMEVGEEVWNVEQPKGNQEGGKIWSVKKKLSKTKKEKVKEKNIRIPRAS